MVRLTLVLALLSLFIMLVVDRALGSRAEFLNAWSVVERLLGRAPSAGPSVVATRGGALGEFVAVVLANAAIGAALAGLAGLVARLLRQGG